MIYTVEKNEMTQTDRYDLTPEEREALMNATPEEIAQAAQDAVKDPEFWAQISACFVRGFLTGLLG